MQSEKGHTDVALHLSECGAEFHAVNDFGDSALTLATKGNLQSVVQAIVVEVDQFKTSEILDHQDNSGNSSLMTACFCGHSEIAEMLLEAGASVNISSLTNYSSLHLPPQQIDFSGSDPSQVECPRGTALDIAVIKGDVEMVSLLLQYHPKIRNIYYLFRSVILKLAHENIKQRTSASSIFFRTALRHKMGYCDQNDQVPSSWESYCSIFQLLFSHDSDLIQRVQCTNPSTLYMACAFGVMEVVNLLLEFGTEASDLYRTDRKGLSYWSSLITIISSKSLLSTDAINQPSKDITELLNQVRWSETKAILSLLIDNGLDINHRDTSGSFALSIASREGHTDLVEFLLKTRKADVNQQNKEGLSSLMEASAEGYVQICRLLLHYKAKVDLQDEKGWSALMFAVAGGYTDLVVHLLGEGAQANLQDVCGTSPLMLSSFTGHVRITKVLLAHDADVHLQNCEGITALMMSSYSGHAETVELLIKYGADVDARTSIGKSALDFSIEKDHSEVTRLLREYGARNSNLGKRTLSQRNPDILSTNVYLTRQGWTGWRESRKFKRIFYKLYYKTKEAVVQYPRQEVAAI